MTIGLAVNRRLDGRGAGRRHHGVGGRRARRRSGLLDDRRSAPGTPPDRGANRPSSSDGARATTNCTPGTAARDPRHGLGEHRQEPAQSRSGGCPAAAPRRAEPDRSPVGAQPRVSRLGRRGQLDERMADELDRHAGLRVDAASNGKMTSIWLDVPADLRDAPGPPRPELRADVVDDRECPSRADRRQQAEIEVRKIDGDEHVRPPVRAPTRRQSSAACATTAAARTALRRARDGESAVVADEVGAGGGQAAAAEAARPRRRGSSARRARVSAPAYRSPDASPHDTSTRRPAPRGRRPGVGDGRLTPVARPPRRRPAERRRIEVEVGERDAFVVGEAQPLELIDECRRVADEHDRQLVGLQQRRDRRAGCPPASRGPPDRGRSRSRRAPGRRRAATTPARRWPTATRSTAGSCRP